LAKTLFDINKVNFDKAITDFGTQPSKESDADEMKRLGYSPKNAPAMQFIADTAVQIAKGDPKSVEKLKQMSLQSLNFVDDGWTITVTDPANANAVVQVLDRKLKPAEFSEQIASFLNKFGIDSGIKQVSLGEYKNWLASKGKKYYTSAKVIPNTAASKAVGGINLTIVLM
jgi:hypothetical protein